jgi:circadian clock protein KaiB
MEVHNTILLRLFVTGNTQRTDLAVRNIKQICEEQMHSKYHLEVIDVLERPQLAEDEKILATPTLIKQLPPPLRRIFGDLSDKNKVLMGLDVIPIS